MHALPTAIPIAKQKQKLYFILYYYLLIVKVGPPVHNYEHEAGSYGDGFT